MAKDWQPRPASLADVPALEALIPLSVHTLQAPWYSEEQRHAALGPVFGVDRQLIHDQTYFVVEHDGAIVGCGGWSCRPTLFGGDAHRASALPLPLLDPARDAARVRAFFVHPAHARQGIGRAILQACAEAMRAAGFTRAALVATLAGEPLYAAAGYTVVERTSVALPTGALLPVVHMERRLDEP